MDSAAPPNPSGNVPEYTVSEISGAVKRTLEGAFGRVRVRGEISEYKRYPSGHMYFSLKDEGGKIAGVVWKSAVARLGLTPESGVEVIATGRISTYGDRSAYQLIVERMEYAGAGALLARIELLRQRLLAEGLFSEARKRALPRLPAVVGVVTSESGAVLHDICTTIARRFPRPLLLWPVPVQGEGAAQRIAAAIAGFGALPLQGAITRPDVLIVARGGGSLDDLMAFNEEAVLRAASLCPIPLISAVGHETDTTLIDFVADRRAPTPTAAAELAVPARSELVAAVAAESARLAGALHRMTQERRLRLGRAERGLPDLPGLIGSAGQRLEDRAQRLILALPNLLAARRASLMRAEGRVADAPTLLRGVREQLGAKHHRLATALPNLVARRAGALRLTAAGLDHGARAQLTRAATREARARLSTSALLAGLRAARTRLEGWGARLESVSHRAVLARGYALVRDQGGRPVTRAAQVAAGTRLRLTFADGERAVTADGSRPPPGQGRLL